MESLANCAERPHGRVFAAADLHGCNEVWKLGPRSFPAGCSLCKDDYLIVAGDFGLPWNDPESEEDAYWLDWLDSRPWTTLFVDGNHENFTFLGKLPVEEWHGGSVHRLRPSVIHLMRGGVFDVAGMSVFAFGGALTRERAYRTEGVSWWPEEMPTELEKDIGRSALEERGWEVDLVVTHCAPANFLHSIQFSFANDPLTEYLFELERKLSYKCWVLGHYHIDFNIEWANASVLYERVVEITLC